MKNLWAPWRSEFILSDKKDVGCIFCNAIKDSNDETNLVVYRGKSCFCILNKYPYSGGHLMITPNEHKGHIYELTEQEMLELMLISGQVEAILENAMHPEGFNIGANIGKAAGAGVVGHFHLHIVPRWVGDTNFMPIMSDTKVVSQSLDDVYKLLYPKFKEIKNKFLS